MAAQIRSDGASNILAESSLTMASGETALRFHIQGLGENALVLTAVGDRLISLACFGDLQPTDAIAIPIRATG